MSSEFAGRSALVQGLPTYVVLDTSLSMGIHQQLLNNALADICTMLITSPSVREFIHLSVIAFNTRPEVVMGMTELDTLQRLPQVTCGGSTNYGPMFRLVRERIERDVPTLSANGIDVLRPVVFLLTDGSPTDTREQDWLTALAALTDPTWRRHAQIITWGFGDASADVLQKVATVAAYLAESGADNQAALASALSSLLQSLVSSAERRQLQLPAIVEEFTQLKPGAGPIELAGTD